MASLRNKIPPDAAQAGEAAAAPDTPVAAPPALRLRIEPTPDCPEPNPGSGGTWVRYPDGGLAPADEATARAAWLDWVPADQAAPQTATDTPKE